MSTFLICAAVWFVVWMVWYRLEWKTCERDDPHFTDNDRRNIFLGSMTWPAQLVLFLIATPVMLMLRAFGWKSKDGDK